MSRPSVNNDDTIQNREVLVFQYQQRVDSIVSSNIVHECIICIAPSLINPTSLYTMSYIYHPKKHIVVYVCQKTLIVDPTKSALAAKGPSCWATKHFTSSPRSQQHLGRWNQISNIAAKRIRNYPWPTCMSQTNFHSRPWSKPVHVRPCPDTYGFCLVAKHIKASYLWKIRSYSTSR